MKLIAALLFSLVGTQALAYQNTTYTCKNGDATLPPNTYKIMDVTVGGATLPYIEVTRHYRKDAGDPNSAVQTVNVKGVAAVSTIEDQETLMIGALRLEFDNGVLFGCTAP